MSNRSLLEFNHDYCPANDAECLALGRAMRSYMRGADARELPPGVTRAHYRHHSDPDPASTLASLRAGTHVVVPREPTEAMLDAGRSPGWSRFETHGRWKAMLAAAPEAARDGR